MLTGPDHYIQNSTQLSVLVALDGALNEPHAAHPGDDARQRRRQRIRIALLPCDQPIGKFAIEHGECLKVALGMAARGRARRHSASRLEIIRRGVVNLFRSIEPLDDQPVRILLAPVDASRSRHRCACAFRCSSPAAICEQASDAGSAVVHAQKRVAIVVELAARHHGAQRGIDRRHLQAGDVFEQMKGVRADVADGSRRGRCAPDRTRHAACFWPVVSSGRLSQPCRYSTATLRISPSSPAAQHGARLAHHARSPHRCASARKAGRTSATAASSSSASS